MESDVQKKRDADLEETVREVQEMLHDSELDGMGDSDTPSNVIRFDKDKMH